MNNSYFKYVERRLEQWAEWYSKSELLSLGYPSCSSGYYSLINGAVTKTYSSKPLPYHEEAEEIETLVRELAEHTPHIASALRYHYFTTGSLRIKANKLKMSHTQFKNYVDLAHYWLAGKLM